MREGAYVGPQVWDINGHQGHVGDPSGDPKNVHELFMSCSHAFVDWLGSQVLLWQSECSCNQRVSRQSLVSREVCAP